MDYPMNYRKNILLTGRPGAGKTTLIRRILSLIRERGREGSAAGFFTEEIREGGARKGFRIKTLSGDGALLSHIDVTSRYRVGKYGVNLEEFERVAIPSISSSQPGIAIIVIDEIGKMECFSPVFQQKTVQALDSEKRVLATVALKGNGFISSIKKRPDVTLIQVTEANRNRLAGALAEELSPL